MSSPCNNFNVFHKKQMQHSYAVFQKLSVVLLALRKTQRSIEKMI